jgi:hypothetical protein
VVFHFPGAQINSEALKTIMGITGTVKEAQVCACERVCVRVCVCDVFVCVSVCAYVCG